MANPYPVGSDQYYEEEARQNAARGLAAPPPVVQAAPQPGSTYVVGGGGSNQGPPAIVEDMASGAQGGGNAPAPAPVSAPAAAPATTAPETIDPSKRIMRGGPGQQQEAPINLPGPTVTGGGGPARLIKGGRTPQSWNVSQEQGLELSPELQRNLEDASWQHRAAGALQADADQQALEKQQIADEKRVIFDRQEAERRQAAEAARSAQETEIKGRVEKLRDINPNGFWDNKSGFQKAMLMISAALSGAIAGMQGRPNETLDRLQRMAEKDTELQLRNLGDAQQELKDFYAQYPTQEAKIAAGTRLRLEDFQRQNEMMFSGAKSQALQAKALENQTAWQDRDNALRMQIEKESQGKTVVQRHDVQTPDRVVGGGGPKLDWTATAAEYARRGGDPKQAEAAIQNIAKANGISADRARAVFYGATVPGQGIPRAAPEQGARVRPGDPETFVPSAYGGQGGFATSAEGAKTANQVADLARQFHQTTQELIKLRNESGSTIPGSSQRNRADAVLANRFRIAKEIAQTGAALSEAEITHLVNPLANLDALDLFSTDSRTLARISAADLQIEQMAQSKIQNSGVVPGSLQAGPQGMRGAISGSAAPLVPPGTARFTTAGEPTK